MASNKVLIEVIVSDNGTAKLVTKGIDSVGVAADNTRKKVKGASAAQDEFNYKLNQGATGVSSAARSFSKLSQTIGNGPNGLVGAYATLAANAFAVSAAFNVLRSAAQVEQMMRGLEIQGGRTGKSLLGVSNQLRELTNYSISAADAMQTTALMSSAGFSTKSMEDLTKVATNAAYALGRNVPDALDRISKGVTKLEPELLDELGIMTKLTEAQSRFALENNKSVASLTSFEKRQAFLNAVVAEGTLKFGGLSEQMSANPYDQLAAAFSNLTNNVLGFLNSTGFISLITFFASNELALTGAVLLFVSTIKNQLLPSITEAAKAAHDLSTNRLDELKKEKNALGDVQSALVKHKKANEDLLGSLGDVKTLPKYYGEWVQAERDKVATTEQHDRAVKSLSSSIGRYESLQSKALDNLDEDKFDMYSEMIDKRKADLANLQSYADRKDEIINSQLAAERQQTELLIRTKLEENAAKAQLSRADAIEALSKGNLRQAISSLIVSTKAYHTQLTQEIILKAELAGVTNSAAVAQTVLNRTIVFSKAAWFGMATGIKAVGSAILTFLPYLGLITIAIDLIMSAIDAFKSDAVKEQEKAFENLNEVLNSTAESVKELDRLQIANIATGSKTAQILTIQSNAAQTLSESFKAVEDASKAAANSTQATTLWDGLFGGAVEYVEYMHSLKAEDIYGDPNALIGPTIEAYSEGWRTLGAVVGAALAIVDPRLYLGQWTETTNAWAASGESVMMGIMDLLPTGFNGIDEAARSSAISVDRLSRIMGRELVDSLVEASGGMQKLANSPALRKEFINNIARAYVGVADAVKALQDSFKATGDAINKFFDNAIPKTPFDDMVRGFTGINRAFRELDRTIGGSDAIEQAKLLTSLPTEVTRLLKTESAQSIQALQAQTSQVDNIKKSIADLENLGENITEEQKVTLEVMKQQLPEAENLVKIYAEQVSGVREEVRELERKAKLYQNQMREYAGELKLVNAISSAFSEIYSKTAEGEKARIDRHNQAVRLQQAQLQIQVDMLNAQIAHSTARLRDLEIMQAAIGLQDDMNERLATQTQRQAEATTLLLRQRAAAPEINIDLSGIDSRLAAFEALDLANKTTTNLLNGQIAINQSLSADQKKIAGDYIAAQRAYLLARRNANIVTERIDITDEIAGYESGVRNLQREIAALGLTRIGDAQAAALIENRRQAVLSENQAIQEQTRILTLQIEESNASILDLQNKQANATRAALRQKVAENQQASINLRRERVDILSRLEAERRVTEGRIADLEAAGGGANIEAELTAARAYRDLLVQQVGLQTTLYDKKEDQLRITAQQAVLETIVAGGLNETIQKIQESIELRQRELDLVSQLRDKQLQIAQNQSKIAIARTGGSISERTQRAFDIEQAERALATAESQYQLRLQAIDAEYNLLDAKRNLDTQTLRTQAVLLQAYNQIFNNGNANPALEEMLGNIAVATNRMEAVDTSVMRENAKLAAASDIILARQNVDLARATYQGGLTPGTAGDQATANILAEFAALDRADAIRAEQRATNTNSNVLTGLQQQAEDNRTIISYLLDMRDSLRTVATSFNEQQVQAYMAQMTTQGGQVGTTGVTANQTATEMARSMYDYARTTFTDLIVDEFGVTSGHGTDSLHYVKSGSRAFDINVGSGSTEANNPTEKARLDTVARDLASRGMEVLWNGMVWSLRNGEIVQSAIAAGENQHLDHLHAEVDEAAYTRMQAIARTASAAVTEGAVRALEQPSAQTAQTPEQIAEAARLRTQRDSAAVTAAGANINSSPTRESTTNTNANTAALNANRAALDYNAEGQRLLGKAQGEQSTASRRQLTDFEKLQRGILLVTTRITADMEELSTAMTSRLGKDLGPQGEIIRSITNIMNMIGIQLPQKLATFNESFEDWQARQTEAVKNLDVNVQQSIQQAQQLSAAFSAAAQVIGSIAGLLKSVSDTKIAGIDREIAAEQKRDGKSAASVAKIDAMEKKKDSIARKSFNTQKKLMMAQAVMSTAAAVASTYAAFAALGNPLAGIIFGAVIGAMGLAQVAIISGMQYESSYSPKTASAPSSLSIGKRGDTVDLAKGPNYNPGGEVGYMRGAQGTGSNASNFNTIGSAYGGELMRGYGNRGFVVGEKGPEVITPETPITVTPANENNGNSPVNATINIQALDASDVQKVLVDQRGNIIQMLREAANASGKGFMEDVNVNVYTRPNVNRL